MYGKTLNGKMLADFAQIFANADIPVLKDAWTNICENQCFGAFNEADSLLKKSIDSIQPFPCEDWNFLE